MAETEVPANLRFNQKFFFKIVPKSEIYFKYNVDPIPLRVIKGEGVNYKPDINVKVNDLNKGKKQFLNLSGGGDEFTIRVLIHKKDTFMTYNLKKLLLSGLSPASSYEEIKEYGKERKLTAALNYWMRNSTVLMVTTDAIDIKNGEYIITGNGARKQVTDNYTTWELTFTRYTGTTIIAMNFQNDKAKKAVNSYKSSLAKKKAKAKAASKPFKNCTYKNMVYSKTKKVTACNKLLQNFLKKKGYYKDAVDGWYGPGTAKAVKKFQTKYQKKFSLKPNGKMDAKTLKLMETIANYKEPTITSTLTKLANKITANFKKKTSKKKTK